MNYYSHHIGDYLTDTAHLSILEDGAYRRLMDRYYSTEMPISADESALFRVLRARSPDEQEAVRVVLKEFFDLTEAGWTHKRCDAEIEAFKAKSGKAAEAANKRWNKPSDANAMQTHSERNADAIPTNNQEPITTNQEPVVQKTTPSGELFDGVDPQIVADFKALRSKQKAPITKTAIDGIRREAVVAGIALQDALTMCCERGWRGFKAEWLANQQARASPATTEKFDPTAYVNRNRSTPQNERTITLDATGEPV